MHEGTEIKFQPYCFTTSGKIQIGDRLEEAKDEGYLLQEHYSDGKYGYTYDFDAQFEVGKDGEVRLVGIDGMKLVQIED